MTQPRYVITSGYHCNPGSGLDWFHHVWWQNTMRYAGAAECVFIFASPGMQPGVRYREWITTYGNLGACGHQLDKLNDYYMCAGNALWLAGAMLAYMSECDLIYKEQDCLAFGPWVETMYRELGGEGNVIVGNGSLHGIATSLFLIRHRYIPQFVMRYLAEGPENVPTRIAEHKFRRMESRWPEHFRRYSFGYDTDRPFNADDPVFMAQKFTPDELRLLADKQLINIQGMPENVPLFSNHNP